MGEWFWFIFFQIKNNNYEQVEKVIIMTIKRLDSTGQQDWPAWQVECVSSAKLITTPSQTDTALEG